MQVELPASKSISNRLLVMCALSGNSVLGLTGLSDCDDTQVLRRCLSCGCSILDVGEAGTAARFLVAYLAQRPGSFVVQGGRRMSERPMGGLVDALRTLGAEIRYLKSEGYLPLYIEGRKMEGGDVRVDASQSSQFISALMLVAPYMRQGLRIRPSDAFTSRSYVDMTARLMRAHGADVSMSGSVICINPGAYGPVAGPVEADWSAAGYWYEWLAVRRKSGQLMLRGLRSGSIQGDSRVAELFAPLGIRTESVDSGVLISAEGGSRPVQDVRMSCADIPDLVPTLAAAYCALGVRFHLFGLASLRHKESDRIASVCQEMYKLGYALQCGMDSVAWHGERVSPQADLSICVHADHRIAMSLTPLLGPDAAQYMDNPSVVMKSYPAFWHDFGRLSNFAP